MIETEQFKEWLKNNTTYSDAVICDTVSRIKRADSILEWSDDEVYQFYLEHDKNYKVLSVSVRSQLKKSCFSLSRLPHGDTMRRKKWLMFLTKRSVLKLCRKSNPAATRVRR